MTGIGPVILIVLLLTVLGSATLIFITFRYYWGERGTPPSTGEARRLQKEEELRKRNAQIKHAEENKWPKRVDW